MITKTIVVPEDIRNAIQKANLERDSRRDILLYIMQNSINIPEEKLKAYEKEYDEKYADFEKLKTQIEKDYVLPAIAPNQPKGWNLDYHSCILTINFEG